MYKLYIIILYIYAIYYGISAIIRFGPNIPVTKPHCNQIVYSKKKFFGAGVILGTL